ncbi:MAG: DUF5522 domain-containing protein [Bacteroidota bacterium]|nr:DUF5522 domain-containing protein [Bacteroidota bacterium]MDX5430236.1 DUF5522 domain-containing protein [Bacteroidota bacterium]MDX5468997.1 DUF5522 domain-containing protein [Bacteroidota bacterium]
MPKTGSEIKNSATPSPLREGVHFYYNERGLMVFTEKYHLERGYCCKSGCLHCPYGFRKQG